MRGAASAAPFRLRSVFRLPARSRATQYGISSSPRPSMCPISWTTVSRISRIASPRVAQQRRIGPRKIAICAGRSETDRVPLEVRARRERFRRARPRRACRSRRSPRRSAPPRRRRRCSRGTAGTAGHAGESLLDVGLELLRRDRGTASSSGGAAPKRRSKFAVVASATRLHRHALAPRRASSRSRRRRRARRAFRGAARARGRASPSRRASRRAEGRPRPRGCCRRSGT